MRFWKQIRMLLVTMFFVILYSNPIFAGELTDYTEQTEAYVTITNGWINKKKVKAGDTLKYRFTVHDNGIAEHDEDHNFGWIYEDGKYIPDNCYVVVGWQGPGHQVIERTYEWKRSIWMGRKQINLSNDAFTVSDKIKVRDGMEPGEWKLVKLYVASGIEDNANFNEDPIDTITLIPPADSKAEADCPADVSAFDSFRVKKKKGVKTDRKPPAPALSSLRVSNTYLSHDGKVTFSLKVTDQTKIDSVGCSWGCYVAGEDGSLTETRYMHYDMKYSKKKKCYQCSISLPYDMVKQLHLKALSVKDVYGNEGYYSLRGNRIECNSCTRWINLKTRKSYCVYKNNQYYGKGKYFEKVTLHSGMIKKK